ncbi:methyl-accepting chemotaxis protein [Geomonas sp. Red32]|uniref:methyl-accepting chemotaxis protein n=1 Tax=Geomonas sp. Red32 TaxID=2912856 RepID=UPI00202D0CDF|nr:methyl-accepting chemotaxis protein [Geomonas sp. Red32]MCM0080508.1 methyl-accepting chemotaxis protein [Geomonas sp. Red32]
MSIFLNLRLFSKFSVFAALVSAIMLVLLGISYSGLKGSERRFSEYTEKYQGVGQTLFKIQAQGLQAEQAIRNVVLNPADDKAMANYQKAVADLQTLEAETVKLSAGMEGIPALMEKLQGQYEQHTALQKSIIALARGGQVPAAVEELKSKETPSWRGIKDIIQALQDTSKQNLQQQKIALNKFTRSNFTVTVVALVLSLLVANLLLFILMKVIDKPMKQLLSRLRDISSGEGDLSKRLAVEGSDEFADTAAALNEFIEKIARTVSAVQETTASLTQAAHQLNNASEKVAGSSEQVAGEATSVANASEEMAATSMEIANNCHMAATSAKEAASLTERGFETVRHTVEGIKARGGLTRKSAEAISSLGERSDKIGDIVSTIEDIADQTNLLALNAAIEAARAGEQGRGFAVVADEVRALAERTTRATREIGEMIKGIQQETRQAIASMEEGVRGTEHEAAEAELLERSLKDILDQVQAVTGQVNQIACAIEEQTATTNDISGNILRISEATQETSRGAQETAGASATLTRLSDDMKGLMVHFRL